MTDDERRQIAEQWWQMRSTFQGFWSELRTVIAQMFPWWAVSAAPKDTVDGQRIIRFVGAWAREAKESAEFEAELRRAR